MFVVFLLREMLTNVLRALVYELFLEAFYGIYINKQSLEKVQLQFEIRIQFCVMCLNLCEDHIIIIHLSLCHVST